MTQATFKPFRMIAIDFDGTLLSPSGKVTERTRLAVAKVLQAGLAVCFATGRNFTESRAILDAVRHYDVAVFVGGAMVMDTKTGTVLHRTLMDGELARQLCGFLQSRGQNVLVTQDTTAAGADYLIGDAAKLNVATQTWLDITSATVHRVAELDQHRHQHTIRVGVVADIGVSKQIYRELADHFGPRVVCHNIYVPAYGVEVVEAFDPAVNKWQAILHVAARQGIEPEQIIAIGDDVNDVPMVQNAGLGVAMGNSRPELLAVAKRIIGPNSADGLACFLEELAEARMA